MAEKVYRIRIIDKPKYRNIVKRMREQGLLKERAEVHTSDTAVNTESDILPGTSSQMELALDGHER